MNKNDLDRLIELVPKKITTKSAELLYENSEWDLESCKYFTWNLKTEIVTYFKNYGTDNFGIIYLPDLAAMGVTRSAPMGSKKWKKNVEKISKEFGSYNIDEEYKDVLDNFISYLAYSIFSYYLQGQVSFLNGLADPKMFTTALEMCIELLLNVDEETEEGEQIWDPYKVQETIIKNIHMHNMNLKNSEEELNDTIKKIPKGFNILKDSSKISPISVKINSKFIREIDNDIYNEFSDKSSQDLTKKDPVEIETEDKDDKSKLQRLEQISEMLEKGLINNEEFKQLKKEIF